LWELLGEDGRAEEVVGRLTRKRGEEFWLRVDGSSESLHFVASQLRGFAQTGVADAPSVAPSISREEVRDLLESFRPVSSSISREEVRDLLESFRSLASPPQTDVVDALSSVISRSEEGRAEERRLARQRDEEDRAPFLSTRSSVSPIFSVASLTVRTSCHEYVFAKGEEEEMMVRGLTAVFAEVTDLLAARRTGGDGWTRAKTAFLQRFRLLKEPKPSLELAVQCKDWITVMEVCASGDVLQAAAAQRVAEVLVAFSRTDNPHGFMRRCIVARQTTGRTTKVEQQECVRGSKLPQDPTLPEAAILREVVRTLLPFRELRAQPCRDFLAGRCSRAHCRFAHADSAKNQEAPSS